MTRKIIEYHLLDNDVGEYEYNFDERIQEFIEAGYEPFGIPFWGNLENGKDSLRPQYMIQALVKYEG